MFWIARRIMSSSNIKLMESQFKRFLMSLFSLVVRAVVLRRLSCQLSFRRGCRPENTWETSELEREVGAWKCQIFVRPFSSVVTHRADVRVKIRRNDHTQRQGIYEQGLHTSTSFVTLFRMLNGF